MARPAPRRTGRRRVVAVLPDDLYVSLVALKLHRRASLEALMEEAVVLLIAKHRVEHESGLTPRPPGDLR